MVRWFSLIFFGELLKMSKCLRHRKVVLRPPNDNLISRSYSFELRLPRVSTLRVDAGIIREQRLAIIKWLIWSNIRWRCVEIQLTMAPVSWKFMFCQCQGGHKHPIIVIHFHRILAYFGWRAYQSTIVQRFKREVSIYRCFINLPRLTSWCPAWSWSKQIFGGALIPHVLVAGKSVCCEP